MKNILKKIYTYNKTSKNPKFKIGDLIRISLKTRKIGAEIFVMYNNLENHSYI